MVHGFWSRPRGRLPQTRELVSPAHISLGPQPRGNNCDDRDRLQSMNRTQTKQGVRGVDINIRVFTYSSFFESEIRMVPVALVVDFCTCLLSPSTPHIIFECRRHSLPLGDCQSSLRTSSVLMPTLPCSTRLLSSSSCISRSRVGGFWSLQPCVLGVLFGKQDLTSRGFVQGSTTDADA